MTDCNIRVICRFRPQNEREKQESARAEGGAGDVSLELQRQTVNVNNKGNKSVFTLDYILPSATRQEEIYEIVAKPTVLDLLNGYNGTIFAYGQTGAGKSFTMFGPDVEGQPHLRGIIPRSIALIFFTIMNDTSGSEFTIKCSFLEIYKESVHDLLNPKSGSLKVRETPAKGVWVEDLTEEFVTSEKEVLDLIRMGEKCRSVAYTKMNATSSRSHSLFTLVLQQKSSDGSVKTGKLNLADLAGSEKVGKTGAVGETLDEAKKINQSLSALGNCINALTKAKRGHVPFRDSKLTFILRESLGGNSKTTLIVNCSPDKFNIDETISTLQFAQRAKMIKNSVSMNKQKSVEELNQIIAKLTKEIAQLKLYIQGLGHQVPKALDQVDHELEKELSTPTKAPQEEGDDTGADENHEEDDEEESVEHTVDSEEHEATREELSNARMHLAEMQRQLHEEQAERENTQRDTEGLKSQLQEAMKKSELYASEAQETAAKLQTETSKWEEEREQMRQVQEEMRRKAEEGERKMKLLQEQMTEGNARYDHMINEMKIKGNDGQAQLAEQLMETEGMLRHRELIISELAEQLADEQSLKTQAQNSLAEAKETRARQDETLRQLEKKVKENTADLKEAQHEKEAHSQQEEKMAARIKRLEEQNASQHSEIQMLISRISELNTPPSSPGNFERRAAGGHSGGKSKIVRPVVAKPDNRKSLGSAFWSLFSSPPKIFSQSDQEDTPAGEEIELSAYGGAKLVLKQGYLTKQGVNNLKSWKKRKCVLRSGALVIIGNDEQVKMTILIDALTVVSQTDEFTFKKNCFGIFHPAHPTHFFYADTFDECSAWMEAILALVEKARQDKTRLP